MEDNEIVSFGSVTVPKSWDDITLDKFQKIEKYYEDKEKNFNIVFPYLSKLLNVVPNFLLSKLGIVLDIC